jgi:hypothetical protein
MIDFKEEYKDLICEDIPLRTTGDPETGAIPQELDLFDLAENTTENGFVEKYCLSDEEGEKLRRIRKVKDDTLSLVIGEDIPSDKPNEYYKVDLYKRLENGDIVLYSEIVLPYLVNHAELFMVDEDDPRYFMYEGYEEKTGGCRYSCMIKPYGEFKGVYRLGLTYPFKIRDINVLIEEKTLNRKK